MGAPARRGRKETPLAPTIPAQRRALAQALRDLRSECGTPSYRDLSRLAHCAAGTLSEAAAGRRLPSWETTSAYVMGCLAYAERRHDTAAALPCWRERWHRARLDDDSPTPTPGDISRRGVPPPAAPVRHASRRVRPVAVTVLLLLTLAALCSSDRQHPSPMTGLYNVVLVAPGGDEQRPGLAERLHQVLGGRLQAWAQADPAVQIRSVRYAGDDDDTFTRVAREHGADVVLRPMLRADPHTVTLSVGVLVTGRALGETPEFAGRHDIGLTEPFDVVDRNPRVSERLADSALHYVDALVAFLRGLGDYALGDFPAAERALLSADREFAAAGPHRVRRAVVDLMLGNAVGAQGARRADEAADHFRRALADDPAYRRTELGLADALRAGVRCEPGEAAAGRLREAADHYRRSLTLRSAVDPAQAALLDLKGHLGLGLIDQCLSVIGTQRRWRDADTHFTEALRYADAAARGDGGRHARWLAAEARAGQALSALAGDHAYDTAARGYEDALTMIGRIDVVRRPYLERTAVFLTNLRFAYAQLDRPQDLARTDRRIADLDRRLSDLALPPGP
ncbi:hypothetical protein [Actinoplanes awajinensis]|uniref:Uncharacterized protein n=1 Tax=Actinoplanes awajinensis subsp. mycoplanecinus TaxID=135947 RepID=A0A117MMC8_9ACTN|nr:hypothetical protein [Actinoplanes awajinensis]KUL25332.1 hypothetical protein ADL15_41170 [Actinoplanes awajinensis subsp. mycoplanecinus]